MFFGLVWEDRVWLEADSVLGLCVALALLIGEFACGVECGGEGVGGIWGLVKWGWVGWIVGESWWLWLLGLDLLGLELDWQVMRLGLDGELAGVVVLGQGLGSKVRFRPR